MPVRKKVVVIGLDGLEPKIVERMMQTGELPNLARLRAQGGYGRVATTLPAQTPVAWSTFATGVNPGGHGIFDFLRRDPQTYLPDLALNRYEQASAFLPPRVVNLRGGTPVWEVLRGAGISSTILRCPCTYPPDEMKGRMLSGMGVPDLRGGFGTGTFYSTASDVSPRESEQAIQLSGTGSTFRTQLIGPRNVKLRTDVMIELELEVVVSRGVVLLRGDGDPGSLELTPGKWSEWFRVRFKAGLLASTAGMVRFLLVRLEPHLELYASPVNFDPTAPVFPISHPWEYATELTRALGFFHTTGMVEDHTALSNGRFGEDEFLAHCETAMREREAMLRYELARFREGLLFCLFDTPDRLQHMFWRYLEPDHPANAEHGGAGREYDHVIDDHYRRCDRTVGEVLDAVDERTLCIVLSDHGFGSFRRGVNLNALLHERGLLALKSGVSPGPDAGEFFRHVDWSRTKAYALGIGSVYLNVAGREREGLVPPADADALAAEIAAALTRTVDPGRGTVAIRGAKTRREAYRGRFVSDAPDLVVEFASGYRASWTTAVGGIPEGLVEDNTRRWAGDHIVDPALVPGVLFMNRPFDGSSASLVDMAPTILSALGVSVPEIMEGASLLAS
jgi:predicted AlkP superfamily phosphohydrolase/phosphomutase